MQGMGSMQPQFDPTSQPGGGQSLDGPQQAQAGPPPEGPNQATPQGQPDAQMGTFGADQDTPQDEQIEKYIDYALSQANLAKKLKNKKNKNGELLLQHMGAEIVKGYEADEISRDSWMKQNQEWMKLAMLVRENRSFPWPKAANIKYPLLATAAMQFSARAYPALVPADGNIVKTKIVQMNPTDPIYQAAERVSQHMSFQILERIPNWEEDMDKLLMTMAISGLCFKKTYYNSVIKCMHSHLVYPENLCVNYHAKNLDKAYRKTEILKYTENDIQEKVNNDEEFCDLDFGEPTTDTAQTDKKQPLVSKTTPPIPDESTPHVFLACHTYWDLDDDGYEEPYVITVHHKTKQVVRIVARWCLDGVQRDEKGKIILIEPIEYYTDFPFIPNPDGSIYALGFGLLIGPLNESTNSIINMLLDSGTLSNLQSGFIGKGLRLRMGQTSLQPGEWKLVNATGEDLQKGIYPLPAKEPSAVLMQLLQMLITSGNQLASIAEIFVGKMPGQNTPATTTQETIQQGMAVFTAIYKRVYRSLKKEFKKLFWLNSICPEIVEEESKVSGIQLQASDYDLPEWTIIPAADPTGDAPTVRMAKLQQVGQLMNFGTIDPMIYTRNVLDALEVPNAQQLIRQPSPPPPDPKIQTEQMKQQTMKQKADSDSAAKQQDMQLKEQEAQVQKAKDDQDMVHTQQMNAIEAQGARMKAHADTIQTVVEQHRAQSNDILEAMREYVKALQELRHTEVAHRQDLSHTQEKHQQTLTLAAQKARQEAKNKPASKST